MPLLRDTITIRHVIIRLRTPPFYARCLRAPDLFSFFAVVAATCLIFLDEISLRHFRACLMTPLFRRFFMPRHVRLRRELIFFEIFIFILSLCLAFSPTYYCLRQMAAVCHAFIIAAAFDICAAVLADGFCLPRHLMPCRRLPLTLS